MYKKDFSHEDCWRLFWKLYNGVSVSLCRLLFVDSQILAKHVWSSHFEATSFSVAFVQTLRPDSSTLPPTNAGSTISPVVSNQHVADEKPAILMHNNQTLYNFDYFFFILHNSSASTDCFIHVNAGRFTRSSKIKVLSSCKLRFNPSRHNYYRTQNHFS